VDDEAAASYEDSRAEIFERRFVHSEKKPSGLAAHFQPDT
jgi:hypothetical protein